MSVRKAGVSQGSDKVYPSGLPKVPSLIGGLLQCRLGSSAEATMGGFSAAGPVRTAVVRSRSPHPPLTVAAASC